MQTDEKMIDRPETKIESFTDTVLSRMRKTGSVEKAESGFVTHLPNPVRRILEGRLSSRVTRLRQYFLMYTDGSCHLAGDRVNLNLMNVNKYVQSHILYIDKARHRAADMSAMLYLYHADIPQILLEVLHQTYFDPDYFNGPVETNCIPYTAVEILTCFLHPSSATFLLLPERLFTDSLSRIDSLAAIACGKGLNWFSRFAVSHFFGAASFTPQGKDWLFTHLETYQELCSTMAKCGSFIKAQIKCGEVYCSEKVVSTQLKHFWDQSDLKRSARVFGHFVTGQCIFVFLHVLQYSHSDYDKFCKVSHAVRGAYVLENFHVVIKQVMSWTDPTHYLIPYLNGIGLCLEMENGFEELLINDIVSCQKDGIAVGIESMKYWNQDRTRRTFPCRFTWFLVHAFCLDDRMGAGWCAYIICWFLSQGTEEVVSRLVESCGAELMDLAHLLYCDYPTHTRVQAVVLEALLRYGGFSHRDNAGDTYESTLKDVAQLRDFSLEAAIFSRKAHCEESMSVEVKQSRVSESDKLKEEGNSHFKVGRHKEAIQCYTEAIAVCPLSARSKQAVYYSNRAECYLLSSEHRNAIHDCNRSLCLDKSLRVKVQIRRAKAYQGLHLDYPAWLDMRCVREDWREEGKMDLEKKMIILEDKLGVCKEDMRFHLIKQFWFSWLLAED